MQEQLPTSAKKRERSRETLNRGDWGIDPTAEFTDYQVELLESLRVLRRTARNISNSFVLSPLSSIFTLLNASQLCQAANIPPFTVFSNQATYEIIHKLPRDAQQLLSCTSLYSIQRERYGAKIVDAVIQHVNLHKLPAGNHVVSLPVLDSIALIEPGTVLFFGEIVKISPDKQKIIDLFTSGNSIELIASQFMFTVSTTQALLAEGILFDMIVDFSRLGLSTKSEDIILQCLKIMGGFQVLRYPVTEVQSQLSDSITDGEIKVCAAKHYHLWKLNGAPQPPDFNLWPNAVLPALQVPQQLPNFDDMVAKLAESELVQLEQAIGKRRMSLASAPKIAVTTHSVAASSNPQATVSLELVRPPILAKPVEFPNITPAPYQLPDESPQLTAEQLQRSEQNRQAALKRRAEVVAAQAHAAAKINSPLSESGNFSQFRSSQEDEIRQSAVRRRIDLNEHMSPARNVNTSINQSINPMSPFSSMPPLEASQNQLQHSQSRLDLVASPKSSQTCAPQPSSPTTPIVLTAEQLQRIEQNRLAALKRRAEVLAASASKKSA